MEKEKLKIIFIDDDQSLLDGLKRYLRRNSKIWDMKFFDGGQKALDALSTFTPDVVVTDMRMPNMNGVELLQELKTRLPHTIRFILSGYSDREMILKSVGVTHQFFSKPVDAETLIDAVNFSNSLYKRIGDSKIQDIIAGISNLPTPSVIYQKIDDELRSPDPSLEKVAQIISEDASVSAKILQLVNSAFFGIGSNISDIQQATMFLGVDVLKYLILSIGTSDESFPSLKGKVELNAFSAHSIAVGKTSQYIAKELGLSRKRQQAAFAAGLLHDIGKLVMSMHFSSSYYLSEHCRMQTADTEKTEDHETEVFEINHSNIGSALLALWGLPPKIVNAVAYHHKPHLDPENEPNLSTVVHIANAIDWHQKRKDGIELGESDLLNNDYIKSLNLADAIQDWRNPQ